MALTVDLPQRGLRRGQVGTVVEQLGADVFEIKFSDEEGRTYAMISVPSAHILVLRYEPVKAA